MKYLKLVFLFCTIFLFMGCKDGNEEDEKKDVTYTVTFNTNGGGIVNSQTVKEGEKVDRPSDPIKENAEFGGWFLGDELFDFQNPVTSNIELNASWTNYYFVKFVVEDEVIKEEKVKEGESATLPDCPTVEGKRFIDWEGEFENITEDTVVNAVFEDLEFYVTFKVDGVNYGKTTIVKYGGNAILPENPVKEGYIFIGWDKEVTNIKNHIDINALFEPIVYTIKYYSGENELSEISPVNYTIEDYLELSVYKLENLYFNGWYLSSEFTGEGLFSIEKGTTGNLELYSLNVNVDLNSGISLWDINSYETLAEAGKGIDAISNLPEIFEQDFYTYLKDNSLLTSEKVAETKRVDSWELFSKEMTDPKRIWNDTSTGGTAAGNGYISVFLYSKIELDENHRVIDVRGGFLGTEPYKSKYAGLLDLLCIMTSYKVTKNKYTPLTTNSNASRAGIGFVLDGYFYGTQGIGASYFSQARNIIPDLYTRYYLNGEEVKAVKVNEGKLIAPSKIGYAFDGWYLDAECTKKLGTISTENMMTLYAGWKENS